MQRFVLVGPSGHMDSPRGMDQYNTAYYQRAADSLLQVAQQILNARQDILNVIATMEEEQSLKEAAENKKTHNEGILTHSGDDAAATYIIKTAPRNSVPSSSDEPKKYNKRIWTLFSHPIKKESCDDEIDTPDKAKWSCDRCGKTFNNRSILKKHHFIHTGEQPYKCDSCNKSFNRRDNMNRHRRVCNKPTVDYSKLFHDQLPIEPSTTPVSSPFPTIHCYNSEHSPVDEHTVHQHAGMTRKINISYRLPQDVESSTLKNHLQLNGSDYHSEKDE